MAAELGLLSMNQQSHENPSLTTPNLWMWNPKRLREGKNNDNEEEDSWVVRAFAEDTSSINGTTWPPRSYTCTFCRREFRSAQALGGHMNVHRRDRAKLHQNSDSLFSNISNSSTPSSNSSTLLFPTHHQEFTSNGGGGLCLLYQLPNPNGVFGQTSMSNANTMKLSSPSTLLSMSPYPPNNNLISPSMNLPLVLPPGTNFPPNHSYHQSSKAEPSISISEKNLEKNEELDLELRLGHR